MSNYQRCICCGGKTGRCQEDTIVIGPCYPLCEDCYDQVLEAAMARLDEDATSIVAQLRAANADLLKELEYALEIIEQETGESSSSAVRTRAAIAMGRGEAST